MSDSGYSKAFMKNFLSDTTSGAAAEFVSPAPTYKLLFVVDGTASMGPWFAATKTASIQLSYIKELTGFNIITQFVIFRDYTLRYMDRYNRVLVLPNSASKRLETSPEFNDVSQAIRFLNSMDVYGNTDTEEAVKTGLHSALPLITENTILYLVTDDLPHDDVDFFTLPLPHGKTTQTSAFQYYRDVAANPSRYNATTAAVPNRILEAATIGQEQSTWSNLVAHPKFKMLRQQQQIFVLTNSTSSKMTEQYTQLGLNVVLKNTNPTTISNVFIGLFMNLTGIPFTSDYSVLSTLYIYGNEHTLAHMNMKNGRLAGNCFMPYEAPPADSDGMLFHSVPGLEINLTTFTAKFKSDTDFKKKVFAILDKIFTPELVMCLTTSAFWGKVWRECCKVKDYSPFYALKDKLSALVREPRLPGLKKWVDDSYNYIQEVLEFFNESIAAYFAGANGWRDYVILMVSTNNQISRDEVLAIARGARNLKALTEFIKSIQLVEYWPDKTKMDTVPNTTGRPRVNTLPKNYVPYCLDTNKLFLYLPHLMCAGTLFSMFPACVLAILAFQSDNPVFKTRAERYLANMIGRWIPIEEGKKNRELLSEFVNTRFIRLVRDFPQFFTAEERRFFQPLMNHVLVNSLLNLEINVDLSWIPIKGNLYADQKHDCADCGMSRSFTLMVQPDKCALCLYPELSKLGDCNSTLKSYMVMCSNPECRCFYAVEHVKRLVSRPKCYPCRNGLAPQYTTCGRCKNRFITPCEILTMPTSSDGAAAASQWLCAMCERCPSEAISQVPLTLETILSEHPEMMPMMGLTADTPLRLDGSLFKNMDSIHAVPDGATLLNPVAPEFADMRIIDRPAHKIPALFDHIREQVETGEHTKDCCFCYEPTHISQLHPLCGNCRNRVCKPCGERHYGAITPGNLVNPTQMHCPMCKRKPTRKVINGYNQHFRYLMGTAQHVFDPHAFYAWCIDCNRICEAGQMACTGDGQMPDYNGEYKCDDCRAATAASILGAAPSINAKNCPECGVATEKAGGCNHITCPNRSCQAHWCWICLAVFPYDQLHTGSDQDIYEHMTHAHGGWWGNDDGQDQGAAEGYD